MARIRDFDFKIGCDPEVFVKENDELISGYGLIPGTKERPFPVDGGKVQVDGMALEFNIDPASNIDQFNNNINRVLKCLRDMTKGVKLEFEPVAHFGRDYIKQQPREAQQLGCEPDYNAYTKEVNPTPNRDANFRTAAGHIHIGWKDIKNPKWPKTINPTEPSHFEACCHLVKVLDAYLGIPSLAWDKDTERQKLYGKAGTFRPTCYGNGYFGVEYRTLSNKWLNYPQAIDCVFANTLDAIKAIFEDYDIADRLWYGKTAREIVDEHLFDVATRVISREQEIKPAVYYRKKREENGLPYFYKGKIQTGKIAE